MVKGDCPQGEESAWGQERGGGLFQVEGSARVKAMRQERGRRWTRKRARVEYNGSLLRKVQKGLWF